MKVPFDFSYLCNSYVFTESERLPALKVDTRFDEQANQWVAIQNDDGKEFKGYGLTREAAIADLY